MSDDTNFDEDYILVSRTEEVKSFLTDEEIEETEETRWFYRDEEETPSLFATFFQRLSRADFLIVYSSLIILIILFVVIVYMGTVTEWYMNLTEPSVDPWVVRGLWILATILTYVGYYFIYQNVSDDEVPQDLIVSSLYIINEFLFILWAALLYYAESIPLSLWIAFVLFTYNFWLVIYVWYISPIAAVFFFPNVVLYVYLLYSTIDLAKINNIPLI